MLTTLLRKLSQMMDDEGSMSYAKSVSLPFLFSSWALGTAHGVQLLLSKQDLTDLVWTMAGVAMVLYASYKTGRVLVRRSKDGKALPHEGELPPS